MLIKYFFIFNFLSVLGLAASISGKFDLKYGNITKDTIRRSTFKIYQIGNYTSDKPYTASTHLNGLDGHFEFNDLPINTGVNETTYFVLYSSSLDFNMNPNRILIEFVQLENGTVAMNGFRNYFGREYFPSKDIIYPEQLESIVVEPYVRISVINSAPLRSYFQIRNSGILKSGPIAGILNSRWKMAGVITFICVVAFPMFIDQIDPDAALLLKEEALTKKKEKYAIE